MLFFLSLEVTPASEESYPAENCRIAAVVAILPNHQSSRLNQKPQVIQSTDMQRGLKQQLVRWVKVWQQLLVWHSQNEC